MEIIFKILEIAKMKHQKDFYKGAIRKLEIRTLHDQTGLNRSFWLLYGEYIVGERVGTWRPAGSPWQWSSRETMMPRTRVVMIDGV